ncbi:MAG: MarC family protein [Alphaproteobacteria bacterium]|nr:MarC family protein [Alphaproteobacteria bacterium]MCD8520349.1 MarC family protein [Alphaproteobacteria bacterium]MCD8571725.1 MarC family protein [Alphaproteobacteria bacterium]
MIEKIITDFLFLWAAIDPIGTLVIFTGLTKSFKAPERKAVALKSVLYAGVVMLGALALGQIILTGMGVRMVSLQMAGGVILFLFALKMIFSSFEGDIKPGDDAHSIAVFPLAIPSIATPGAIMAVILITDNHIYSLYQQILTALVLVSILVITYIMMLLSERILKVIGHNGAAVLVKVMGMLLAALSVELIMEAIGIERWLVPETASSTLPAF